MAKRRGLPDWGVLQWARHFFAVCAWACALFVAVGADAHADVDTSTGLGDNTLTNSDPISVPDIKGYILMPVICVVINLTELRALKAFRER
ncbi:unnamed protein product [Euphydryas editha]|uniref:Uncharacterized protein n=1 Tax=Euphydryas editha TaxID=104508 RepID=A0AAU9UTV9_EUPED|nr:unnamed protein product [Euphydryas editha]